MIIPSNLYLNNEEQNRFEQFVHLNQTKIQGILVYLDVRPFGLGKGFEEYYKYIASLAKKYNLKVIGFFNETYKSKFSNELNKNILDFKRDFESFRKMGIDTIIRPYNWYNFNFYLYKVHFYIPTDSILDIIKRLQDKNLFFSHLEYLQNGITVQNATFKKQTSLYSKRLSIAHADSTHQGDLFYKTFIKSDPKFIDEIDDIYFGKEFVYDDGIEYVKYGNVMGVSATDEQIDYLFSIQEQYGVSISLTLNQILPPKEILLKQKVLDAFIVFIDKYYKRGLRVITISDIHLIKTGVLQKRFPLMKFKNTVNHKITDTQSFINFAHLGYDYIQLDRSLNRDLKELKKIKKANEKLGKKLYLLASEYCMYSCPFKNEHDNVNIEYLNTSDYFVGEHKLSHISCDNWRHGQYSQMPRIGVDIILNEKKDLDEYLNCVDILKFSGRMVQLECEQYDNFGMFFMDKKSLEEKAQDSFCNRMAINYNKPNNSPLEIYNQKDGKNLLELLKVCKNECYDCHVCEDVFKVPHFDSLIELNGVF